MTGNGFECQREKRDASSRVFLALNVRSHIGSGQKRQKVEDREELQKLQKPVACLPSEETTTDCNPTFWMAEQNPNLHIATVPITNPAPADETYGPRNPWHSNV